MKALGLIVFILFLIRTFYSFGAVLEMVGTEEVYYYLGDLMANLLLIVHLWKVDIRLKEK